MKAMTFKMTKLVLKYLNYPYTKLGYSKNLMPIENLPTSHYYQSNTFFDSDYALHQQYLTSSGWLESKSRNQSSKNGVPVPWITYPSLELLNRIQLGTINVLEFGAGASTHFFSKSANRVISYEFNYEYLTSLQNLNKKNTTLLGPTNFPNHTGILEISDHYREFLLRDIDAGEIDMESALSTNWNSLIDQIKAKASESDLIFIDGGPRTLAAKICSEIVGDNTLVILDNSDRDYESKAAALLTSSRYVEIPFTGLGPLNPYSWTTSFFVRSLSTLEKFARR